jgi:SAM-dependent methyltransferase
MANSETLFDSLAYEYDAWFDLEGKHIFAIEASAFKGILPKLPKPWLEIGVGSGRFAQYLGIETGLDPSIKLLDMASKRGINVFLGRGEEVPIANESLGTVFFIVTICFVDSPLKVLKEANRLLKRDGRLVLGLVLRESPWGEFYQVKKGKGHRFYKHANFYSYEETERLLEQGGFKAERVLSTLFQRPGEVNHMESPQEGFSPNAGFTIIQAVKYPRGSSGYEEDWP